MNSVTDQSLADFFRPLTEVTAVVDKDGRIYGHFTPKGLLPSKSVKRNKKNKSGPKKSKGR
jgi:hypothetical protein